MALAVILIVVGLVGLYFGVQAIRNWYKENAAGGVTQATNTKLMAGFFVATVGLLGGISLLVVH